MTVEWLGRRMTLGQEPCPPGSVRDPNTGICIGIPPGATTSPGQPQQAAAEAASAAARAAAARAQSSLTCLSAQGLQAIAQCIAGLVDTNSSFCIDAQKYLNLPACADVPRPVIPSCLDAGQAELARYCKQHPNNDGPNAASNGACWLGRRDPTWFAQWASTPACAAPGAPAPGAPAATTKKSSAVPVVVGVGVGVTALYLFFRTIA